MKYLILFLIYSSTIVYCQAQDKPNIILIVVDDMGFSDIASYGSEIQTPNITKLATGGVKFSNFYNNSRCCPSRATLMTGLPAHMTGIGHMVGIKKDKGEEFPSYRGALNKNNATLAEVLKSAGYATLMTGKWHLGERDPSYWPLQRGFDKFYGCTTGSMNYFYPKAKKGITYMNQHIKTPESTTDRKFYTTDAFTDYGIQFIEESIEEDAEKPFFLYLAYNAPHWPIQAHEEDIAKYRGTYMDGWDKLREQRYQRQIKLGLIDVNSQLSPRTDGIPAWDSLTAAQQDESDLRMATYAAMIDRVDQNIGKLMERLDRLGKKDNTLILFLSDNGACAEGPVLGFPDFYDIEKRNQSGNASYGRGWSNLSSTPFRLYKHYTHEGGAATPFIMNWPKGIKPNKNWYTSNAHIIDVMPTLLSVSGASYPKVVNEKVIPEFTGIPLTSAMKGKKLKRNKPLYAEHENNAFVIDGKWKLVGNGVSAKEGIKKELWELYDLSKDRTELNNLAEKMPERVNAMEKDWLQWAEKVGVYPKPVLWVKPSNRMK